MISMLGVGNGDRVKAGDTLAMVETTKVTAEIQAEIDGIVAGLSAQVGESMTAGETLLWLAGSGDWRPPQPQTEPSLDRPMGLRLTDPAREMAEAAGVDLSNLPLGPLITEEWLKKWLEQRADYPEIDERALLVYGGGGHGKAVIDLIRTLGEFDVVGVIDDGLAAGTEIMGAPVVGGADELDAMRRKGAGKAVNAVGGIGNINSRVTVFQRLKSTGYQFPTLVHPEAFVEVSARLADGVQVFPHAYVGSEAELDFGVIVNTAAVVSHDCHLSQYANVAPGSLLAGGVKVGPRCLIGMGVTVNLEVEIGAGARIGNSAVVKNSVPAAAVVAAGSVWPAVEGRN
jgi:sugar O-acyltransferase (sialic acid O-acetyltransferase NeuD family)